MSFFLVILWSLGLVRFSFRQFCEVIIGLVFLSIQRFIFFVFSYQKFLVNFFSFIYFEIFWFYIVIFLCFFKVIISQFSKLICEIGNGQRKVFQSFFDFYFQVTYVRCMLFFLIWVLDGRIYYFFQWLFFRLLLLCYVFVSGYRIIERVNLCGLE